MKDEDLEDYSLLKELEKPFLALTSKRIYDEFQRQEKVSLEGYQISRLEHSLQAATRAYRDGADTD